LGNDSNIEVSLEEILEASSRIQGHILENTPLVKCAGMDGLYLKLENLQLTGSFKIRGAANKLLQVAAASEKRGGDLRGIITASAGNHGQAVALCARELGFKAKIVVPETTPAVKIAKIKQFEPELILRGKIYDEAEAYAKKLANEEALEYVSAYNDADVIAGQGTLGLEILKQLEDPTEVIVPVGGGGLIAGVATAIKLRCPEVQIVGVQSKASPSMYESFLAGRQIDTKVEDSIADGLSGNFEHGSITLDIIRKFVDRMVLVREESIRKAIRFLWEKQGQQVEGSGAATVAALFEENDASINVGRKRVAILSGGNIDFEKLRAIVSDDRLL
jgi:threonine dehydratase